MPKQGQTRPHVSQQLLHSRTFQTLLGDSLPIAKHPLEPLMEMEPHPPTSQMGTFRPLLFLLR